MVNIQKNRFQLESADADEISELMSATLVPMKVDTARLAGTVQIDMQAVHLGRLSISMGSIEGGMGAFVQADHPRHVLIVPLSGAVQVNLGRAEYAAQGSTIATHPAGLSPHYASTNTKFMAIEITPDALVQGISAYVGGPAVTPVEFSRDFELRAADMDALKSFGKNLLLGEMQNELLTRSPIAAARAVDMLVAFALELCPNTYSDRLRSRETKIAPRHVKRAIEHMHENIMHPITMPELARVSGVSLRALQYGFNQFVGMSPLNYLQNLRLVEACKQMQSDSNGSTVAEIALRWGFTNPGRFSALCQKAFGKKPAQLKRSRPQE